MKFKLFSNVGVYCAREAHLNTFRSKYSVQFKIGSGNFGDVFCVLSKEKCRRKYVAKVVQNSHDQQRVATDREYLPVEIWCLRQLSGHVNIVTYTEHFIIKGKFVVIMEYLKGYSDLFDYIEKFGKLSCRITRTIVRQLAEAIGYCFHRGIDHRDIKEENIMYHPETEHIKLIDMGSASILSPEPYTTLTGTDIYVPPEYYHKRRYFAKPAAVWSIGCVTFCCLTSTTPFNSIAAIVNTGPNWNLLQNAEDELSKDFVKSCMRIDEELRLKFSVLKYHMWLNDGIERLSNLDSGFSF